MKTRQLAWINNKILSGSKADRCILKFVWLCVNSDDCARKYELLFSLQTTLNEFNYDISSMFRTNCPLTAAKASTWCNNIGLFPNSTSGLGRLKSYRPKPGAVSTNENKRLHLMESKNKINNLKGVCWGVKWAESSMMQ